MVALVLNVSTPSAQAPYVHVNPVVAKLSRGERVFGVPVTDLSLVNARALAREPLIDYITIDFEHSILDMQQLEIFMAGLIDRRAIREKQSLEHNIAVFVELPQDSYETTVYVRKNALDIGVMGFVFSNLETKEDALRLVKSIRLGRPRQTRSTSQLECGSAREESPPGSGASPDRSIGNAPIPGRSIRKGTCSRWGPSKRNWG